VQRKPRQPNSSHIKKHHCFAKGLILEHPDPDPDPDSGSPIPPLHQSTYNADYVRTRFSPQE